MRSIESDLYCAFNAPREIRASNFLAMKTGATGNNLTIQELIANSGMIRGHIHRRISEIDYRTLLLYFKEISDVQATIEYMSPIRNLIWTNSKLHGDVDEKFFDLVCVSEFWGESLFKQAKYGPMLRYLAAGQTSELLTRRKKRIIKTLKNMRQQSISSADRALTVSDTDCDYIDMIS